MPTNNCLTVTFALSGGLGAEKERQGGRLTGTASHSPAAFAIVRVGGCDSFTASRSASLSATFGLVCAVSVGELVGYEVLWVQDGMLLTVDNGNLFVVKE